MDRLNLSSPAQRDRVGRSVNERYKAVCSSMGLQTTTRTTTTGATAIGSRVVTFGPTPKRVQKLLAVFDATVSPAVGVYFERSFDYLRNKVDSGDSSREYAIQSTTSASVTIFLGGTATAVRTLTADIEESKATLAGTNEPAFAEAFHDILTTYAMSIELDKLEKTDQAREKMNKSDSRLGELRLHIAKSAYLDIIAGSRGTVYTGQPLIV